MTGELEQSLLSAPVLAFVYGRRMVAASTAVVVPTCVMQMSEELGERVNVQSEVGPVRSIEKLSD